MTRLAHHSTRRAAAAAMHAIAARTHPARLHDHLCARCQVTWRGAERDCWSCGLPATSAHTRPGAALHLLLTTVGKPLPHPTR
ncbi:hypothetical protein [Streptomyces albus]|uniref:hypothetical protein n=1 Tax=Streptomyces albus TaxID=1888 RepID=UPI00345544A8